MNTRIITTLTASSQGGTLRKLTVHTAGQIDRRTLAKIYNGVLRPGDEGMAIKADQMAARLLRDPESVLIASLDNIPVGLINIVKRSFPSAGEVSPTHQLLTDNETFASTDPDHGSMWFCPWVAVGGEGNALKVKIDGQPKTVGQVLAYFVGQEALHNPQVQHLYAYSSPRGLKAFMEQQLSSAIDYLPDPIHGTVDMKVRRRAVSLIADKQGLLYSSAFGPRAQNLGSYWNRKRPDGKKEDFVYRVHSSNGAVFVPEGVFPLGQIYDASALGFRTLLEYLLPRDRPAV